MATRRTASKKKKTKSRSKPAPTSGASSKKSTAASRPKKKTAKKKSSPTPQSAPSRKASASKRTSASKKTSASPKTKAKPSSRRTAKKKSESGASETSPRRAKKVSSTRASGSSRSVLKERSSPTADLDRNPLVTRSKVTSTPRPPETARTARILQNLARRIAPHSQFENLLAEASLFIAETLEAQECRFFFSSQEKSDALVRFGDLRVPEILPSEVGIGGHVLRDGRAEVITDPETDPRFDERIDRGPNEFTATLMALPLASEEGAENDAPLGILQVYNRRDGRSFEESDLSLAKSLTHSLIPILRWGLEVRRRETDHVRQDSAREMLVQISSQANLSSAIQRAEQSLASLLSAERAVVYLNDEESNELWAKIGRSATFEGEGRSLRLSNRSGLPGECFQSRTAIDVPHAYADMRFEPDFDKTVGGFTRSLLYVPLFDSKGMTIGVTEVANRRGGPFREEDRRRLETAHRDLAPALEKVRSIETLKKENGRLRAECEELRREIERAASRAAEKNPIQETAAKPTAIEKTPPPENARELVEVPPLEIEPAPLPSELRTATLLFARVHNLQALAESSGPSPVIRRLNHFYSLAAEPIEKENGTLLRPFGESVLALFAHKTPAGSGRAEDRALRASLALLESLRQDRPKTDGPDSVLEVRIGIHTAEVVVGSIDLAGRTDPTTLGTGVEVSKRLQQFCRTFGARILLSRDAFTGLEGSYCLREVDAIPVPGKREPLGLYEILDDHSAADIPRLRDVLNHFREGLDLYRRGEWDRAIVAFRKCTADHPHDPASQLYIDRCLYLKANPPVGKWTGVWARQAR